MSQTVFLDLERFLFRNFAFTPEIFNIKFSLSYSGNIFYIRPYQWLRGSALKLGKR